MDDPFGPPHIPSTTFSGIQRLRDTLAHKISRSAWEEREFLKKEKRCKIPLTERNIDTLTTKLEQEDARHLVQRTREVQISEWLRQLS